MLPTETCSTTCRVWPRIWWADNIQKLLLKKQPKCLSSGLMSVVNVAHLPCRFQRITESQNHRMFRVGRDFCGSSSPTLLSKQGCLQQAAQDLVQVGLEYLQRRRPHNLPGQPGPGLHHPQSEVLPHVQLELPLFQLVPISPCPVTGHHCKESGPVLLTPTLKIFLSISKVPSQAFSSAG